MPQSHVISGLITKRAELAGIVLQAERALAKLKEDLAAIDNTIRLFDPDSVPGNIKAKARRAARYPFHIRRTILGVIRKSGSPMTISAIAEKVAIEKKINISDASAMAELTLKVRNSLAHNATGLVRLLNEESGQFLWRIAG
jgi:hypothetical protein